MFWRRTKQKAETTPSQPQGLPAESDRAESEPSRAPALRAGDDPGPCPHAPHGDAPVGRVDDELGRGPFAELIATQIALSRPASGMVMSLVGAWGAGKSSVLRMI